MFEKNRIRNACMSGDLDTVKKMYQKNPSVLRIRSEQGASLLFVAIIAGQCEVASFLLEHGLDVNYHWSGLISPIHMASEGGQENAIDLLLEYGADINSRDCWG